MGRKTFLLVGFGALPIRAALFTVSDNEVWLVSLQVLDGVAAGTLDALIPLVLADVMLGTGRYNAARGVLGTVQGIAGSLSNAAVALVVSTGYNATFLALSTVGVVAWLVLLAAMPKLAETSTAAERPSHLRLRTLYPPASMAAPDVRTP